MELLEGCDLGVHIASCGALSPQETVAIVHQLAKALEAAHSVGVVHRDVKPSNVFLCNANGEVFVKLLDFGLAKSRTSPDTTGTPTLQGAGTPPYMSPEQILGGDVDARSDVWSMGALAFHCLTGRRPFDGETLGAVALAIHTLALPRITDIRPELPPAIDEWFARACARAPGDRFPSPMALVADMAPALEVELPAAHRHQQPLANGPLPDRTLTEEGRTSSLFRRRPLAVSIGLVAFAASLLAGLAGVAVARRTPTTRARIPESIAASASVDAIPASSQVVQSEVLPERPTVSTEAAPTTVRTLGPRPNVARGTVPSPPRAPAAPAGSASGAATSSGASTPDLPNERH